MARGRSDRRTAAGAGIEAVQDATIAAVAEEAGLAGADRDPTIVAADKAGTEGEALAMTAGSPRSSCRKLT